MRIATWTWAAVLIGSAAAGCIPKASASGGGSSAGAENTADGKACGPDGVLDDGEDVDNRVLARGGRTGYWYTFADKVGTTVTPAPGGTFAMADQGANGSTRSAQVNGKIGTGEVVFGGVGVNFVDPKGPYDASAFKGVSFYARRGETSSGKVRLKVPDANTDPDGGACSDCYNDFGIDLELTTTWTKYVVPFSSMKQLAGWGAPRPAAISPAKLYGLQWQVNSAGASYEIWIDDIQFTGCP
jgi:endoglucanase